MGDAISGHDNLLVDESVELVGRWLRAAEADETRAERSTIKTLRRLIEDPDGLRFTMGFVDRVARPDAAAASAHQLASLVKTGTLPGFLSPIDRLMLKAGALLAPRAPGLVMPLAMKRMRSLVGHLVVDAEPTALAEHLAHRRGQGFSQNVNLLGEAVLGEEEADRRLQATAALVDQPHVDYVSVKVSAIASQLNYWDWDGSLDRIVDRLRLLFRRAAKTTPRTFINLDMEEYHDLEITIAAFQRLLDDPEFFTIEAGIVLQTYLPDSFAALRELVGWASARQDSGGGGIKVRLVKGANLAMEQVDASIHGWEQAPYRSKAEVDANYKRCVDWALRPNRTKAVRVGVASHNLFDVAWAHLVASERGVTDRIDFEMLQGMAPAQARAVKGQTNDNRLLLYTPIVTEDDFDVAISYLFRRLEENAQSGNFLRSLFDLDPDGPTFAAEADRFRNAVSDRWSVGSKPQRSQQRPAPSAFAALDQADGANGGDEPATFVNEPDTDPVLASNRDWAHTLLADRPTAPKAPMADHEDQIDDVIKTARRGYESWSKTPAKARRRLLHAVADELARNRGPLITAMVHEANKTLAQADPEISEAIDFARYYGDRVVDLVTPRNSSFSPFGVMAVVPPWNFPVAIPAGGVLAALAAGNAVVFKPAPQTPRCAEIVAECCWAAGIPADALQFVRTPDNDLGRRLITSVDGVILTGSADTARLFRSWKPDLKLLAETSGKNALIITPHADIDLAVDDLVASAFGHAGQKCSAASLAICVGDVYDSPRFRRQLVDSVRSLAVGRADVVSTSVGPTIEVPAGKLLRGLTSLEQGEEWLVAPEQSDDRPELWRPGVRIGVKAGSWFHQTECFGPVLGVMAAGSLDEAIDLQNGTEFGLTGGLHSLDEAEIQHWIDRVEVGNAYVNRAITGAIVQRQPFGGWKQSSVGPGVKAGGPNYVAQLGTWQPVEGYEPGSERFLAESAVSDDQMWRQEFSVEHDPTELFCEANILRYRRLPTIAVRVMADADPVAVQRVLAAAAVCSVATLVSSADTESDESFMSRLEGLGLDRVRVVGETSETLAVLAAEQLVHLADGPVTADGRVELLHYLREQAISRTLHRFGNVLEAGG